MLGCQVENDEVERIYGQWTEILMDEVLRFFTPCTEKGWCYKLCWDRLVVSWSSWRVGGQFLLWGFIGDRLQRRWCSNHGHQDSSLFS